MKIKENKYLILDKEVTINFKIALKYTVSIFFRFLYSLLFFFIRPCRTITKYKYNVSICAIFKDEADYLKEWIEYHRIIGVNHFYLYNNNSTDDFKNILQPYVINGIVTLIDWPIQQGQMQAYQHWAENFKNESKWVGFIDIDEFVVPNKDNTIYDFLEKFENRPVVIIYWRYFGSSNLEKRNIKGLVCEDFTIGWYKYADIGKYFFNTKYDYIQNYKHNRKMHYMWGGYKGIMLPPVNIFNRICIYSFNPVYSDDMPIQINHYLLKSKEEYINRKSKKGGGVNPIGVHDMEYFTYHNSFSNTPDNHINKYMDKLKKAMDKNNNI